MKNRIVMMVAVAAVVIGGTIVSLRHHRDAEASGCVDAESRELNSLLDQLDDKLGKGRFAYREPCDRIVSLIASVTNGCNRLDLPRKFADGVLNLFLTDGDYDRRTTRVDNYSKVWPIAYGVLRDNGEDGERLASFFKHALVKQKDACFSADDAERVEDWIDVQKRLNRSGWMRDNLRLCLRNMKDRKLKYFTEGLDEDGKIRLTEWFSDFSKNALKEIESSDRRQREDWRRLHDYTPPELIMKPNFSVRVVDENGFGVDGALVYAMGMDGGRVLRSVTSFTLDGGIWVPPYGFRSVGIAVCKSGYGRKSVSCEELKPIENEGKPREMVVQLARVKCDVPQKVGNGNVHVKVTDDKGHPIPDAAVLIISYFDTCQRVFADELTFTDKAGEAHNSYAASNSVIYVRKGGFEARTKGLVCPEISTPIVLKADGSL